MKIFNTLTRRKEEFEPLEPGHVRMYVCGVTPYDLSHVGHARSAVVFDVIHRYLEFKGYRVTYVRNYTDVEDKIIKRAQEEAVPSTTIAERYIAAYREDMERLAVLPPDAEPKATEHIPEMLALIERLIAARCAYVVDGDVYFEVRRFERYGRLSGKPLDELVAGARVEVDERKRDPRDFALWKAAKPGEPSWDSPWGPGRPGWHIECSAMATRYLGESFDIHGGGQDLVFPHHECEIAQSEAATGRPFVRVWIHNGFVNLDEKKMSKSLGNILNIRELVKRHDPDAIRLWLLGTHYRSAVDFTEEVVGATGRALQELHELIALSGQLSDAPIGPLDRRPDEDAATFLSRVLAEAPDEVGETPPLGARIGRFVHGMDDDFNSPEALAAIFSLRRDLRSMRSRIVGDQGPVRPFVYGVRLLVTLGRVLGLFEHLAPPATMPPERRRRVEVLIAERGEARRRRDWRRADEIRDRLAHEYEVTIEDTPSGTRWTWKGA